MKEQKVLLWAGWRVEKPVMVYNKIIIRMLHLFYIARRNWNSLEHFAISSSFFALKLFKHDERNYLKHLEVKWNQESKHKNVLKEPEKENNNYFSNLKRFLSRKEKKERNIKMKQLCVFGEKCVEKENLFFLKTFPSADFYSLLFFTSRREDFISNNSVGGLFHRA